MRRRCLFKSYAAGFMRERFMSLPYLLEALHNREDEKVLRFVRLHLGDGNEETGRREINKSWIEAMKVILSQQADAEIDSNLVSAVSESSDATKALLFFHLHFSLIRRSGEWI